MIEYKACSEVADAVCYEGFKAGFVDYMITLEMTQEAFLKRFFGPEGNSREHSFIALEEDRPLGVMLGGIRDFGERRTLRCGGMCVVPDYRFRGVAVGLFERHREEALANSCQQLFLEVITQNKPALQFYKRIGYQKVYDLNYFAITDMERLKSRWTSQWAVDFGIETISLEELTALRDAYPDVHINWQNEMAAIACLENQRGYGIRQQGQWVAALSINQSGQFHYLYVKPEFRSKGMAGALLVHSAQELNLEKIKTGFPNNASLKHFLQRLGFKQEKISQYEMYLPL